MQEAALTTRVWTLKGVVDAAKHCTCVPFSFPSVLAVPVAALYASGGMLPYTTETFTPAFSYTLPPCSMSALSTPICVCLIPLCDQTCWVAKACRHSLVTHAFTQAFANTFALVPHEEGRGEGPDRGALRRPVLGISATVHCNTLRSN